ncbi:DUF1524 domain-containing protein [Abiotrophia sp.]|uniref:GmrSD restriction endonuclease domain-containing protein n=1 Tax=Abiotrophia sp. TaxID=76631 RepID=UPI001CACB285|nr:DUF1524 domain-containing protein [Abiotrophia sp.]MBF0937095.1 HNH endonuclease [Abiotrophia sp.]
MVISVRSFKKRFIRIFGDDVWNDFIDFGKSKHATKSFNSMHDVIKQLNEYKKKIANRNLYTKRKNLRFARFVLISIEKAFRPHSRSIKFNKKEKLKKGHFNRRWEVEHIFPKSTFDNKFKGVNPSNNGVNKHSLGNLTLITRKLNGTEGYKDADFQIKKSLIQRSKKNIGLYINCIFKNQSAKLTKDYFRLLEDRQLELKNDFDKIFKPNEIGIPIIFFRDVLGYSEGAIKSTPHITHLIKKWCRKRKRLK